MVGLKQIQLFQPSLPSDTDGTNFYAPVIRSFTRINTDFSSTTGDPYLTINLQEYSTDSDTQFRGVYIQGTIRSSEGGSNMIPSSFNLYWVLAAVDQNPFSLIELDTILFNPDANINNIILGIYGYTYGVSQPGSSDLYSYVNGSNEVKFYLPTDGSTEYNVSGIYYLI